MTEESEFSKLIKRYDALRDALNAMADYGSGEESMNTIAQMLVQVCIHKAIAFKESECERQANTPGASVTVKTPTPVTQMKTPTGQKS